MDCWQIQQWLVPLYTAHRDVSTRWASGLIILCLAAEQSCRWLLSGISVRKHNDRDRIYALGHYPGWQSLPFVDYPNETRAEMGFWSDDGNHDYPFLLPHVTYSAPFSIKVPADDKDHLSRANCRESKKWVKHRKRRDTHLAQYKTPDEIIQKPKYRNTFFFCLLKFFSKIKVKSYQT